MEEFGGRGLCSDPLTLCRHKTPGEEWGRVCARGESPCELILSFSLVLFLSLSERRMLFCGLCYQGAPATQLKSLPKPMAKKKKKYICCDSWVVGCRRSFPTTGGEDDGGHGCFKRGSGKKPLARIFLHCEPHCVSVQGCHTLLCLPCHRDEKGLWGEHPKMANSNLQIRPVMGKVGPTGS